MESYQGENLCSTIFIENIGVPRFGNNLIVEARKEMHGYNP